MCAVGRAVAGLSVLIFATVAAASAQRPQTRDGFWIGFGFGGGSAKFSCNGCADLSRETGFTGYLKMGGTLSPKVLLGGESTGWTKSKSGETIQTGNLTAAVYFYPAPASGFFVKGGPSFSFYREDDGTDVFTGTGFGFTAGLGYDVRVGTNISITPVANFLWGSVGDLSTGGVSSSGLGFKQNVFDFSLGITFH